MRLAGVSLSHLIKPNIWLLIGISLAIFIYSIEIKLPLGVAGGIPYVVPVALCYYSKKRKHLWIVATLCLLLTWIGYALSPDVGIEMYIPQTNRIMASASLVFMAFFVDMGIGKIGYVERRLDRSEIEINALYNLPLSFAHCELIMSENNQPKDWVYLNVNKSFLLGFGLERKDQVIGKRYSEVFPETVEDNAQWLTRFSEVAVKGKANNFVEHSESLDMWFDIHCASPAKNEFIIVFQNITEFKKNEERIINLNDELIAINNELEGFTYSVAHDLRAPIRAINNFSKILKEDLSGENAVEKNSHYIDRIIVNSDKMGQLIDDLLEFSRLGKIEPVRQAVNIEMLVKQIIEELFPDEKSIIKVSGIPHVLGDSSLIKQVFVNLISNALKYSAKVENQKVEISSYPEGDYVVTKVEDNGAGFDMKFSEKLFQVFERLHHIHEFEGNGIGLALSKRIVEKMDGEIWGEGQVDKGASFYVKLKKSSNE